MKRITAMLLAVLMLFTLAACQSDKTENRTFATGTVTGNKYVNTYAGISCELDMAWTFLTDEEIRKNNEEALGIVGDEYADVLANADYIEDMMATYSNQTDTININLEKMTGLNLLLSEEEYAKLSMDTLKGSLESMGMTDVELTAGKETFAGAEHAYIAVTAQYEGIPVYERIVIVKCAVHMMVIAVCTWQADGCKAILDQFKAA